MPHPYRLSAAALLACAAFAHAQTPPPVVPARAPVLIPLQGTQPPVQPPAAPNDAPAAEQPKADEPPAEEPKAEETRYFVENLLGRTAGGQQLLENGWRVYGWTQGSYTASTVSRSTLPVPFIDRANEFSLNQNWLHVEKGVDTSKKEFQLGGAVDLILPGTDARFTISRGLMDSQVGRTDYPIDLFQAYVDLFAPNVGPQGTTFRAGKFATFLEYEAVQAIATPFVSRSYLFQYDPFTHTGVLAITPLNDDVTVSNGVVLGNDVFIDPAAQPTYLGQVRWAPKDGRAFVTLEASVTSPRYNVRENFAAYNDYNLVFGYKLTDHLQYVLDASFSHMDNIPLDGRFTSANWYGFVNYLLYDVTDQLQSKLRVELFEDTKGVRTGTAGLYTAVTTGLTWKITPSLWVLPEVRYDHASRGRPFEGDRDMFTATIGTVVRW